MTHHFEWKTIVKSNSHASPSARWGHSCCIVDDNFYLFGGFANSNYMSDLWQYSTVDLQWRQLITKGDKPECRSNATLNYDKNNNQLLLFGGGGPNKQRFNTVSILDLCSLTWVELQPFQTQAAPWERTYHVAQFYSPYLIVFGGEGAADLADLWLYNINTLSWKQIKVEAGSVAPRARRFHASCLVGDTFYLFGGCYDKYELLNDLYALDLSPLNQNNQVSQLKWRAIPMMGQIEPRWGHSMSYYNGNLYIFAGRSNEDINNLYTINLENGRIREVQVDKEPRPRRRHGGGFIGSCLVIFSGFDGNYLEDFIYINVYQLLKSQSRSRVQKINSRSYDQIIDCLSNKKLQINSSKLGRYFSNRDKMMNFINAINGHYQLEEMQNIMQTFEDGFGLLPLASEHKKLLQYLPSLHKSSMDHTIMQFLNENSYESHSNSSLNGVVELDSSVVHKYLSVLDQHWQNDTEISFNQTKFRVNRDSLSRRSQYFCNLFSSQYQAKYYINLECGRFDSFKFRLLIGYLRTGVLVVPALSSTNVFKHLLELADYFSLPCLVSICEEEICKRVAHFNYQSLLQFSINFNLPILTEHCSFKYLSEFVKNKNQKLVECLLSKQKLHPKTYQLYTNIRFDLIHSAKNSSSHKSTVLNAENDKQNKPANQSQLKAIRKSNLNY